MKEKDRNTPWEIFRFTKNSLCCGLQSWFVFWMCHILVLAQRYANPSDSPLLSLDPPPQWFHFTVQQTTKYYGDILSNSDAAKPQATCHTFVNSCSNEQT